MDIQRGDQVYYRGEVWTVEHVPVEQSESSVITLRKMGKGVYYRRMRAQPKHVQRVEQVR